MPSISTPEGPTDLLGSPFQDWASDMHVSGPDRVEGEDVSLGPTGLDLFLVLLLSVLTEELDQGVGEADRSASGAGLGGFVLSADL
jgi:hypothetical protein